MRQLSFLLSLKLYHFISYPRNFSVTYPLSLKLFCQLSLIPKTPNSAYITKQLRIRVPRAFYVLCLPRNQKTTTNRQQQQQQKSQHGREWPFGKIQ